MSQKKTRYDVIRPYFIRVDLLLQLLLVLVGISLHEHWLLLAALLTLAVTAHHTDGDAVAAIDV